MIAIAKKKALKHNIKNVNLSVLNASDLNFPDQYFDAVVICNSLHVMEKPERVVLESKRVLKKGGLMIAPNACLGESSDAKKKSMEMIAKGFPAYHVFSTDNYCDMFKNLGLHVMKREPVAYRMPMIYVVAQKC